MASLLEEWSHINYKAIPHHLKAGEQVVSILQSPDPTQTRRTQHRASNATQVQDVRQAVLRFRCEKRVRDDRPAPAHGYRQVLFTVGKDGIRAKAKTLERLKGFLRFCVERKRILENPAADLEAPVGGGSAANRMPLTDSELVRIYEACDKLPETRWNNNLGWALWRGDDVKTILILLCWTGLRISDGAMFDMSRVTAHPEGGANIFLRIHKTKGPLFTWVDDWLYERLLVRQRKFGAKICSRALGAARNRDHLWRRRINRVFDLAGPLECGTPTPHLDR